MKKEPFESTTGEEGKDVALTKETNINFPDMKEWISEFFKTELLVSRDISSNPYIQMRTIIIIVFSL